MLRETLKTQQHQRLQPPVSSFLFSISEQRRENASGSVMCAEWIGNWAPSARICVRPHYRAELLLLCSRPCRCQVWPSVQNYDRPLPKLSTHYTQQGFAWKPLATSALQTPLPPRSSPPPPFVMERLCRRPRLRCCGRVKGRRLCPRACWGERIAEEEKCSLLLPPAMSSSSSCICRWKIFSWRSHSVCFIFSRRVTM